MQLIFAYIKYVYGLLLFKQYRYGFTYYMLMKGYDLNETHNKMI